MDSKGTLAKSPDYKDDVSGSNKRVRDAQAALKGAGKKAHDMSEEMMTSSATMEYIGDKLLHLSEIEGEEVVTICERMKKECPECFPS